MMRRALIALLALALALPLASLVPAAEDKLVVYTAYEENELKDFWEQFKKDLPDLAAKASYVRGSTGPTMAKIEAERANPQADVIWGVFNDYLTGAAKKGLLEPYAAKDSQLIPARFKHPENMWQGVTLLTVGFAANQKKMAELKLSPPRSWAELIAPRYKGHIVMSNPRLRHRLLSCWPARSPARRGQGLRVLRGARQEPLQVTVGAPRKMAASERRPSGPRL
jgi:iron(III) transport system substrate-binding protein